MKIEDVKYGQTVRLLQGGIALKRFVGEQGIVHHIEPDDDSGDEMSIFIKLESGYEQYEYAEYLELVCD